jgi:hypothetical protein
MNSLTDFRNYRLKKEIIDLIDKSIAESKRKVKEETTTKQQILMLDYLGILEKIDLGTNKKAYLISKLLNRHEQNIKDPIIYINSVSVEKSDIKTEDNLKAVRKIFEDCGLTKEIDLINNDLKKIGVID